MSKETEVKKDNVVEIKSKPQSVTVNVLAPKAASGFVK
jgi:hypothetical protein